MIFFPHGVNCNFETPNALVKINVLIIRIIILLNQTLFYVIFGVFVAGWLKEMFLGCLVPKFNPMYRLISPLILYTLDLLKCRIFNQRQSRVTVNSKRLRVWWFKFFYIDLESRKKTCTGLSGAFQRKDLIKKDKLVSQGPLQIQHIKDQVPVCAFQSPFFFLVGSPV